MAAETAPSPLTSPTSPTSSPERSFTNLLRSGSLRRRDGPSPSNVSISSEHGGLRRSIDKGLDKVLSKTKSSASDPKERRGSRESSKLSKLVPRRRRRRKDDAEDDADGDEQQRRGRLGVLGISNSKLNISEANLSEDSIGGNRSGGSSLLTDDSEPEPSRPVLMSRNSHKGYLTLSSPLITAESIDPADQRVENGLKISGDAMSAPSQSADRTSNAPFSDREQALDSTVAQVRVEKASSIGKSGLAIITKRPETPKHEVVAEGNTETPPNKAETPSTLVTPPTPVIPQDGSPRLKGFGREVLKTDSLPTKPLSSNKPFGESISHRRTRSALSTSSKFGSNLTRPLTPTLEETKTPGGSLVQPSGSTGFFSSMISATQTAVSSLSNTFSSSAPSSQRARSGTTSSAPEKSGSVGDEEVILTNSDPLAGAGTGKEPAVNTLGSGNLSLTHLGIAEQPKPQFAEDVVHSPVEDTRSQHTEEVSAAEAVSAAYAGNANEKALGSGADGASPSGRPVSISSNVGSVTGNGTPPRSIASGVDSGRLARNGSVRSKLSGRRRRTRGSSSTTTAGGGGAIAAALTASHAALINPTAAGHRPTGFAVASSKRNREFHQLFKSVPDDDYLIEDYSAALQRDILLQGRLYVSERHICFSSNILGWITNLVMSYDEVIAIEKKSTAVIFPNAIVIQTLHARNVFASFIGRDTTYDLLIEIWRIGHPNLKQSANGHVLDDNGENGDKAAADESTDEDSDEESDDYYDEDAEDNETNGSIAGGRASAAPSEAGDAAKGTARKPSANGTVVNGSASKPGADGAATGTSSSDGNFPGPTTHGVTECTDQDTHYDKLLVDTTIPAPLGKIYSMMFGPESGDVMKRFLVDDQKSTELQMEDDKKGMGEETKAFSYSYIKPLYAAIGPKQTKCIVNQTLDFFDLERSLTVTCSTQTPDVPSGSAFVTKTKYCLMWGPSNSTRMIMTYTIEWSAKSWLKGPIEKGANEGQGQYGKDLAAFFQAQVTSKTSSKGAKGKGKGKRKKGSGDVTGDGVSSTKTSAATSGASKPSSWGMLQPLQDILGPVGDIITPTMVLGFLLVVVVILWMRSAYRAPEHAAPGFPLSSSKERLAAYEELWQREESELWDWLEDRIRLRDLATSERKGAVAKPYAETIGSALDHKRMDERQIDDAIRVTKQRLSELEDAVVRRRERDARPHS